jgi:fructokinase
MPKPTAAPSVLVLGEALADVVAAPDGSRRAHPGGSPANVALGLARLGHTVHLATRLGDDGHGRMLRNHLVGNGVLLTKESVEAGRTSTATATLDRDGRASYTFDIDWDLPPRISDQVQAKPPTHLHTGSIAALLAPGAHRVLSAVRSARPRATVSYDPNLRPALLGEPAREQPRVEALVALSDVVKASDEDLAWLCPGQDPDRVAADWLSRGPSLVVLTRGAKGASAYWRRGRHDLAAEQIEVADTIGAGDAFMSGLISGLLAGGMLGAEGRPELLAATSAEQPAEKIADALTLAMRSAAATCGRVGADPPTRAELLVADG